MEDRLSIPGRTRDFLPSSPRPHRLWGHVAYYPMDTGVFFSGKAARKLRWPLNSI